MKALKLFFISMTLGLSLMAQSPHTIKYQAVVRDINGNVLVNQNVTFRISILPDKTEDFAAYRELHSCTTNSFGLVDIEIGNGVFPSGEFSAINWASGQYFLKVELDPAGGNSYQIMGISQFVSVPYALFAQNAANGFSGNYNDLSNKPILFDGTWSSLNGKPDFAKVATSGDFNDLINKPLTDGSETKVTEGTNIKVTGLGTTSNPYKIDAVNTHYPGELFGGGVVFYIDHTGEHGLICCLVDLADFNCAWSNITLEAIGDNARSTWDGQSNSTAIINQSGHTTSAAKLCDDYTNADYGTGIFSDWFLPSIDQLSKLYNARFEVNKTLYSDGNSLTYPLLKISYWSSNEGSSQYSFHYDFQTVSSIPIGKYQNNCVRAIRSF